MWVVLCRARPYDATPPADRWPYLKERLAEGFRLLDVREVAGVVDHL